MGARRKDMPLQSVSACRAAPLEYGNHPAYRFKGEGSERCRLDDVGTTGR